MKHPLQAIEPDSNGINRFRANPLINHLVDAYPGGLDGLLASVPAAEDGDREQLAQLVGYSVSGIGALPYVSRECIAKADALVIAAGADPGTDDSIAEALAMQAIQEIGLDEFTVTGQLGTRPHSLKNFHVFGAALLRAYKQGIEKSNGMQTDLDAFLQEIHEHDSARQAAQTQE